MDATTPSSMNPKRPRHCRPRWRRSRSSSARARSCGSARVRRFDDIEVVSTGSLGLDIALGVGGLPRGRVIEIYGPESSGKTTLTLQVIAEMQKLGGISAFIDAEHALDAQYAAEARRQPAGAVDLAARHRRAGARDRRRAGALGRGRPDRHRLGGRAHPQGRARGRHGRQPARPAGAPDEPGAAQAHRVDPEDQHDSHLHQPDPHEDRRHVRHRPRPRPAATRSSSTPRCGSTSGASARSRRATR